jgi:hypothetical protein
MTTYAASFGASIGQNIRSPKRFTDQKLRFCSFMALGATFRRMKLRLPTTLEGPGAINIGRNNMAPKI